MIRSRIKPMIPMVRIATMIRANDWLLPFWNSSHTNFPNPGFWANISEAINTIQPTPREIRKPVKISGKEDGKIILKTCVNHPSCKTLETLIMSLSTEETPWAVLIKVGHKEQSDTVIAEMMKHFSSPPLLVV